LSATLPRPLTGVRVLEFAGLGPAPFCGMLLADMGAEVVRLDRPPQASGEAELDALLVAGPQDLLGRGKHSIVVDLRTAEGREVARRLAAGVDVVLEGFRPGVMERLGLGPDALPAARPRLVYGRMTGWGQDGPLARTPGHDINFIALAGALHMIGRAGAPPVAPPALLGDFGAGGLLLAFGIACALLEARASGRGQVVDAAIVDGAALLTTLFHGLRQGGQWRDETGRNFIDGGAHFYDVYACRGGGHVAVGALEPHFFHELVERAGLDPALATRRFDAASWRERKAAMAEVFLTRSREEWTALFEGSDACVTPVLSLAEAPVHPHARARRAFVEVDGIVQPAPAPRFSASSAGRPAAPPRAAGCDTRTVLEAAGFPGEEIDGLLATGVVRSAE